MPQLLLFIAIMFELVASTFLKLSDGFRNIFFGLGAYLLYAISFWCFAKSLISINFSVAYAIWCSVGIVVTTLISIFIFKESTNWIVILGIILILAGVLLVQLFTPK